MKILAHKQQIRTTMDTYNPVIIVGADNTEAWTVKHAACLTADYPGKADDLAAKREAYINAVLVRDGEIVELEGHMYTAKYNSPNVSDPITFIRVGS